MLMQAGLSAYGNALNENEYEKGDGRLVLESLMAGLGAGAGAAALRGRGSSCPRSHPSNCVTQEAGDDSSGFGTEPGDRSRPPGDACNRSFSGFGHWRCYCRAGLPSNLNMVGSAMSGRQQDYYEEDQPALSEAEIDAIAAAVMNNG